MKKKVRDLTTSEWLTNIWYLYLLIAILGWWEGVTRGHAEKGGLGGRHRGVPW